MIQNAEMLPMTNYYFVKIRMTTRQNDYNEISKNILNKISYFRYIDLITYLACYS